LKTGVKDASQTKARRAITLKNRRSLAPNPSSQIFQHIELVRGRIQPAVVKAQGFDQNGVNEYRPRSGRYENSPALLVLGSGRDLSNSPCNGRLRLKVSREFQPDFQPSASRTVSISLPNPSDKSLGYSHSVRFADEKHFRFWTKPRLNDSSSSRASGRLKGAPLSLDFFVNAPGVNHVKQKSLGPEQLGYINIHDAL